MSGIVSRFNDYNTHSTPSDEISERIQYRYTGYKTLKEELEHSELLRKAWELAKKECPSKSPEIIALYCYSLEKFQFYKVLNAKIREWYDERSNAVFPFKNYVNLLIRQVQFEPNGLTLYRGVSDIKKISAKVGDRVSSKQFESHSLDIEVAQKFAGYGTLYKLVTKIAIPILDNSKYKGEKEYLNPFGMHFKITDIRRINGWFGAYNEVDLQSQPIAIVANNGLALHCNGNTVTLNKYNGCSQQLWYTQQNFIFSDVNGYVLDIKDGGVSGSPIIVHPFNGSDSQNWSFSQRDGYFRSNVSNLVLEVHDGYTFSLKLLARPFNGQPSQKFMIKPVDNNVNSTCVIG